MDETEKIILNLLLQDAESHDVTIGDILEVVK